MLDTPPNDLADLIEKARAIVIDQKRCSTSFLRRELGIGYNKAARIVEALEDQGTVSAPDHLGKREIFLTPSITDGLADWIALKNTGASTKAIVAYLTGHRLKRDDYPRDAGDFGHCEQLLEMVPKLRSELHRMADVNQYWAALIPKWEEIKNFDDEGRTDLIHATLKPLQDADPNHVSIGKGISLDIGPISIEQIRKTREALRKQQGKPPMKHDRDFAQAENKAYSVAAEELRQFIEQFESLDAEKKDITEQQKDVMGEAKARGYDTKALKKIVAMRKRDKDDLAEEEAIIHLYKSALGMG